MEHNVYIYIIIILYLLINCNSFFEIDIYFDDEYNILSKNV